MLIWYFYHNEWTGIDKYYASKTVFYSDFHSSTYHSFPIPGSHLGHYIAIITSDIYSVLSFFFWNYQYMYVLPTEIVSWFFDIIFSLFILCFMNFRLWSFSSTAFKLRNSLLVHAESTDEPIVVILQFCYFFPLAFFVLYYWVLRLSVCLYYSFDFVCYTICLLK